MQSKTFITAAIALAGATFIVSAHATPLGEATPDYPGVISTTLSRAEVQAEAQRAQAAGLIQHGERTVVIHSTGPSLTRAQVVAETLEAIRVGAIYRGERSVTPSASQLESIRQAGLRALATTMAAV